MSFSDVILFISSTSMNCGMVMSYVATNRVPVKVVRLDTVQARKAVQSNKNLQIKNVPSLMVVHHQGTINLFEGAQPIIAWFEQARAPVQQPVPPVHGHPSHPTGPPPPLEYIPPVHEPAFVPLDEEEEQVPDITTGTLYGTPSKKKKKKGKVAFNIPSPDEVETPTDIVFEEPNDKKKKFKKPKGPPTQGLLVGPAANPGKKSNKSIKELAKQMEADMKATYGYDDKDLPRTS